MHRSSRMAAFAWLKRLGPLVSLCLVAMWLATTPAVSSSYIPTPFSPPTSGIQSTTTATALYAEAYTSLTAALNAAGVVATANESGSGHSIDVYVPNGVSTLSATFTLVNGMWIHGVHARPQYSGIDGPTDFAFVPNGGSVISCLTGASSTPGQCFSVPHAGRGIGLEDLTFTNATNVLTAGSNNVDGMAWSEFHNIWVAGSATPNVSGTAFELYNSAHLVFDRLRVWNFNTAVDYLQQSSATNYGNSTFLDTYVYATPKSAANGNNTTAAIQLRTLVPASGTTLGLNDITFNHLHIENLGGDNTAPTFTSTSQSGANNTAIVIHDFDCEGANLYCIYATYTAFSEFRVNVNAGNTYDVGFGNSVSPNAIYCTAQCKIAPYPTGQYGANFIVGVLNSPPTTNGATAPSVGAYLNVQTNKLQLDGLTSQSLTDGFSNTILPDVVVGLPNYISTCTTSNGGYGCANLPYTDCGTLVEFTSTSNSTATLSTGMPVGCTMKFMAGNTGSVTLAQQSSTVPIVNYSGAGHVTRGQYDVLTAKVVPNNAGTGTVWVVSYGQ